MSLKTIVTCDICKEEITTEPRVTFCYDMDDYYHAHVGCLNDRIHGNRMKTCDMNKVRDVADFLFFDGFKRKLEV